MDSSGKWRATEQHGPATIEVWRTCWEVFAAAAICIGIAQPAVLMRYAKKFEERVCRYERAWHICLKAEERCRTEFWGNERRRQARFAEAHPTLSSIDRDMPWNSVIKEAADNLEYWTQELQEPAFIFMASRQEGRHRLGHSSSANKVMARTNRKEKERRAHTRGGATDAM